jgi:RND family efflux transporter MFP subunit
MMSTIRRWTAVAMVCAALAACGKTEEDPGAAKQASPSLAVTVAPAQVRGIERAITVSGPVSAWEEMQLGVELGGQRVTGLYVDVGEHVRRGQVLLELDARTLESELAQARAAHREAEAGAALAQANLRRAEPLLREKYIPAGQVDELRAARDQANARVATARAGLDAAQLRRDFAELRAPDDGVISRRLVQPGQVVAAGTELLRLIRDGRLEWRAELADAELARVDVGDPVMISAPGGGEVEGQVRAVSPGVAAETRTGTIYADLPDPDGLRVGAYVEGRILTGAARVLSVPVAAVVQRDGNSYVFTVDAGNVARRLRVRTGATSQGHVEILDGLKPGTQVIEQGAGFVGDGDPVRIVDAAAAKPAP